MTLEDINLEDENDSTSNNKGLNKLIPVIGTYGIAFATGYLYSDLKIIEAVKDIPNNSISSNLALLGCVLISSPLLLAWGTLYSISRELKKYNEYKKGNK